MILLLCSYCVDTTVSFTAAHANYTPSVWFHVVLNFLGPSEGISIYHDGQQIKNSTSYEPHTPFTPNEVGQIVIGRLKTNVSSGLFDDYASVIMDELVFTEQSLNEEQILALSHANTTNQNGN